MKPQWDTNLYVGFELDFQLGVLLSVSGQEGLNLRLILLLPVEGASYVSCRR